MAVERLLAVLLVVLGVASLAVGQSCNAATNCSHCLDISARCRWCADEDKRFADPSARCAVSFSTPCTNEITLPMKTTVTEAEDFTDNIQVSPQRFTVDLPPRRSVQLKLSIQPAVNAPIDLYFLMDHSFSMNDDLDTLKSQTVNVANAIKNVSTNFLIGYGTYVDKTSTPFMVFSNGQLVNQCKGCKRPYAFYNNLALAKDIAQFTAAVKKDTISSNLDNPEGTFDAMVQATVCPQVGWRTNSRRIMVVITDALSHTAGDGKLAGIIVPNDGKCHIDDNGYYDGLDNDYPSISYLSYLLQTANIVPIFSVTQNVQPVYQTIANLMDNTGAVVVRLTSNSSNIVKVLAAELGRLVQEAPVVVLPQTGVEVSIDADCPQNGSRKSGNLTVCTLLSAGSKANYTVTLTAKSCKELRTVQNLTIRFVGFGDVVVNINPQCSCDCDLSPMLNASLCSHRGSNVCGLCKCTSGYSSRSNDSAGCLCDNNPSLCESGQGGVCNGRGQCVCGQCECTQPTGPLASKRRVYGKFCECDNFQNCLKDDRGRICGGEEQGECDCGTCNCKPGYTGKNCNCSISEETCRPAGSTAQTQFCSGEGTCNCGKCECFAGFHGEFCDVCQNQTQCTTNGLCERAKACLDPTCPRKGCELCDGMKNVGPQTIPYQISGTDATQCSTVDSSGCSYKYWVAVNPTVPGPQKPFYPLHVETVRTCPEAFNYVPLTMGIVFGLVAIGIGLLLLWRLIIHWRDRQEYKRFVELQAKQQWSKAQNPFYKAPTTTTSNPTYMGESTANT